MAFLTVQESLTWAILFWMVAFLVSAALVGIVMYMLICISDLENDFINPHDAARRVNGFVFPEISLHSGLTVVFALTGHWLMFLINLPLALYHFHLYLRKEHMVDVTEAFNQISVQRRRQLIRFVIYLTLMIATIFRMVERGVTAVMESHGGAIHAKVLGNVAGLSNMSSM
ncbi:unnamed protein product [Closterium sp. Naga37s-1]|nr:unnamed protein product [Closterium sp. Naga37s-1]